MIDWKQMHSQSWIIRLLLLIKQVVSARKQWDDCRKNNHGARAASTYVDLWHVVCQTTMRIFQFRGRAELDSNPDLCDVGALLHQFSYLATWELDYNLDPRRPQFAWKLKCWSNSPASQGSGFESRSKLNYFLGHPRYYISSVKKTARIISYYDSLIAIAGKKKHAFTQDSDDTRIFGAHSRVACAPSLSRVRVYFAHLSVCRPSKRPLAVKDYFNGFRLSLLG